MSWGSNVPPYPHGNFFFLFFYLKKKNKKNLKLIGGKSWGRTQFSPCCNPSLSLSLADCPSLACSKQFPLLAPAVTSSNKSHRCTHFMAVSLSLAASLVAYILCLLWWNPSLVRSVCTLSLSLSLSLSVKHIYGYQDIVY